MADSLEGFDLGAAATLQPITDAYLASLAVVTAYRAALVGEDFSPEAVEAMVVDMHRAFVVEFTDMILGPKRRAELEAEEASSQTTS